MARGAVAGNRRSMSDEPSTQELELEQARRESAERERAETATEPAEAHSAKRRADKAAYLRSKLEEQERADSSAD